VSKLLNIKLTLNNEEYIAGMDSPLVQHTVTKIEKLPDDTVVKLTASFSTVLKEEEKAFFEDVLQRLLRAVEYMFEKQLSLKEKEPILDESTGVFSRAYLTAIDQKVFSAAKRHNYPVAVGLITFEMDEDIGKLYEECVIREGAKILQRNFRSSDIIIREDDKSFLIVMPFTEVQNAQKKFDLITNELNMHEFCGSKKIHIKSKANVVEYDQKSKIEDIIFKLKNLSGKKEKEWI
jgi:diguanylate cyclase (GGDEF)-like protein